MQHLAIFAEEAKSGLIHSGKYNSTASITEVVHVVVFCNTLPCLKGSEAWFSLDRTGGNEATNPHGESTVMLLKNGTNKFLTNREVYCKSY